MKKITRALAFRWAALCFCLLAGSQIFGPLLAQPPATPATATALRDLPKNRSYELRMLYLEDPRLPSLTPNQRTALYAKIEHLLATWYGYKVRVRETGQHPLAAYYAAQETIFIQQRYRLKAIDLNLAAATAPARLRAVIAADFAPRPLPQIERYLNAGPLISKPRAVEVAEQQFRKKLTELHQAPLADGTPFFDPDQARLNSYAHATVLTEHLTEADFVLTNSMIGGADADMPIYVIARGGLTTAFTTNNARSSYQAAVFAGLFPFLSEAPVFLRERGRIPDTELLDVIATFCLHELGHFFLRYAEHYDHPHCVHVAPTGLNHYTWHQAIRAGGPCTLPHQKVTRY
jgi:hypothetical protein